MESPIFPSRSAGFQHTAHALPAGLRSAQRPSHRRRALCHWAKPPGIYSLQNGNGLNENVWCHWHISTKTPYTVLIYIIDDIMSVYVYTTQSQKHTIYKTIQNRWKLSTYKIWIATSSSAPRWPSPPCRLGASAIARVLCSRSTEINNIKNLDLS